MKTKMLIATLMGCLVWQQGVLSQTDTTDTDTNQSIGTNTINPPMAAAASTNESPNAVTGSETTDASAANPPTEPAVSTNESPSAATGTETTNASAANPPIEPAVSTNESPSAATGSETTNASAANPAAAPATGTNEFPSAATGGETTGASSSNPQASAPANIPLIQFQDVPITTAIENLTRQAGINYLLDPKIAYGQPDQNGQVKAEPTLSIRWENITYAQALLALLDNYGLQLVEDRRSHIARITTKDPTAPPPLSTRVIQLKYASTSNMLESVQASLTDKRSKVLSDSRTSQLVVVATENEQEAAVSLVNQLDKPTRQVLIETKLVEVSSKPQTTKGVDWSGTLAAQHVSFGNGFLSSANTAVQIPGKVLNTTFLGTGKPSTPGSTIPGSTTTTITPGTSGGFPTTTTVVIPDTVIPGTPAIPNATMNTTPDFSRSSSMDVSGGSGFSWNTLSGLTPSIGFLSADGASAVLSFLNQSADAQIISTPRVVTLDNQMATIEVTASYPIINLAGGTQNSSGSSSVTYSNVGTILQVTPRISANDYIWLKVIPVLSSHSGDQNVTVTGGQGNPSTSYTIPLFSNRKIDSQVMIPDGNTLVMGGLVQDNPTAAYTKVPLLGDIPGLGWAFRSESKTMIKNNLIIFMTPSIIKNADFQPATSAAADFLQSKPAMVKNRMNPHSIWDGAQPRGDWSNPAPIPGEFDKN